MPRYREARGINKGRKGAPGARAWVASKDLVVLHVEQHLAEGGGSWRGQLALHDIEAWEVGDHVGEEGHHGESGSEASSHPEVPCRAGRIGPERRGRARSRHHETKLERNMKPN